MATTVQETSISVTTRSARRQRKDIQGLRAIAVVLVVAFHAGVGLNAGFAGVDIFFVISGFVIMKQIARLHDEDSFSVVGFYARRIQRLFPALIVMLAVVLLFTLLLQAPLGAQGATAKMALGASLSIGNFVALLLPGGYFDTAAANNPLLHVWSLGVEEQFYLIFPLLLVAATVLSRRRFNDKHLCFLLATLSLLSLAFAVTMSFSDFSLVGHPMRDWAFYMAPARAWEFGAGAVLFIWTSHRPAPRTARQMHLCTALGVLGVCMLVLMNLAFNRDTAWPGIAALIPVLATVCLIQAGAWPGNFISRALATRPLVRLGDMSYSIYLWHWPVIVFTALMTDSAQVRIIAALVSLVPAWLAYRYVEKPLRVVRLSQRKVFVGAGSLIATLAISALVLPSAGVAATSKVNQYRSDRTALTFGRATGCMLLDKPFQESDVKRCTTHVPASRGLIMLVGDSHADALSTGVIAAANRLGYDTLALTGGGCEFSRVAPPNIFVRTAPSCRRHCWIKPKRIRQHS